MKEYGSNVQKLVEYILTIEDKEKRTKYAYLLVELMRQVHPNMKDAQDYSNKLWDDLFVLSRFELDVESPYAPPPIEAVGKRPKKMDYVYQNLKYKHYGHNVRLLVANAINAATLDERVIHAGYVARLMRILYTNWNKEVVDDSVILNQLLDLSKGKLAEEIEIIKSEGILDGIQKPKAQNYYASNTTNRNNYSKNNNNRRNNNNNNSNNANGGQNNRNYKNYKNNNPKI